MPVQAANGAYSFRHSAKDLGNENINLQVLAEKRSGRRFSSWRGTRNQVVFTTPSKTTGFIVSSSENHTSKEIPNAP